MSKKIETYAEWMLRQERYEITPVGRRVLAAHKAMTGLRAGVEITKDMWQPTHGETGDEECRDPFCDCHPASEDDEAAALDAEQAEEYWESS